MDASARRRVIRLAELEAASGRSTERILRVARTIADLGGDEAVREHHLDEAVFYRSTDARLAALRAV
jgi:magnesium chelatase family protein